MTDNFNTGMDSSSPAFSDQGISVPNLKEKAAEGARQLVQQAESQASSRIAEGKQQAASTLTSLASTLRRSGQQLRDEEELMAGDYVERAAAQIDRAAQFIENAELRDIVKNVETFARKNPGVFIGAAFAIGLAGARFLKSSQGGDSAREIFADREVRTPRVIDTATNQASTGWGNEYGG